MTEKTLWDSQEYVLRVCKVIVGLILMVLGFFILLHPNFKQHPYPMMGISCLAMAG